MLSLASSTHSYSNAEWHLSRSPDKSNPSRHRPYASLKVNVQGGGHGSAQQAASLRSRENIVELLLDKGAEANAQDGYALGGEHAIRCRWFSGPTTTQTSTYKVHIMVMRYKRYRRWCSSHLTGTPWPTHKVESMVERCRWRRLEATRGLSS